MANILITGGSGLVGRAISELLLSQGHEVRWLSRDSGSFGKIKKYKWELESQYIDEDAFVNLNGIIHLAGAGIVAKRWTKSYKKEILDSRVKSSELLFHYVNKLTPNLEAFVGGSAVGYYGNEKLNRPCVETDIVGSDFLAQVCLAWENTYTAFSQAGIRTSVIRTGIVLSEKGGAYKKMKTVFQFGLGTGIGAGNQAFPWIHINDLAAVFVKALFDKNMQGTYNATASETTTNLEFSKALANSFNRPLLLPNFPSCVLDLVLGERAITMTKGVDIDNSKLKSMPFSFQYDNLEKALKELAEKK